MKTTPKRINYINEFNKKQYKMYQFRVRKDNKKLIKFLDEKVERNSYIVSLLETDSKKEKIFTLKEIKNIIKPILNSHGISEIYLFGSYARGEANKESDIDIYCEQGNIKTLFDTYDLIEELKAGLKKSVDLVFTSTQLDEHFKIHLMEDLIKLC